MKSETRDVMRLINMAWGVRAPREVEPAAGFSAEDQQPLVPWRCSAQVTQSHSSLITSACCGVVVGNEHRSTSS
jgi:hypothetical protein